MHTARELTQNNACRNNLRRSATLMQQLSTDALQELVGLGIERNYDAGQVLFGEKGHTAGIFLLQEGQVRLSMNSTEGKRLSLRIARAGDVLGLAPALSGQRCETTAETLTPAKVIEVCSADFRNFLAQHPEAYGLITQEISRQYGLACEQLRNVGLSSSAPEKLARLLLDLSENGSDEDAARVRFMLTHEQIGEFIGTSRETVTRTLSAFRMRRLIAFQGCMMTIPSRSALENYAHC